jgi:hypothetical protein
MGCCHDRDFGKTSTRPKPPPPDHLDPTLLPQASLSDLTSMDHGSTTTTPEKRDFQAFADLCKAERRYPELIRLMNNQSAVSNSKAYFFWSEKPKTVGSLAVFHLCGSFQEDHAELTALLEPCLPQIIDQIRTGSDDMRDNSLMLLYYLLDYASDSTIVRLLELNIFNVLMRSLMCSKEEIRHVTSTMCCKIYKDRPYAKKLFLDMKGGKQLVQQILWSSENATVLESLLENLSELVQDDDTLVMQERIARLNEARASDIIREISNGDHSAEVLELIDYLLSVLSSEETKDNN